GGFTHNGLLGVSVLAAGTSAGPAPSGDFAADLEHVAIAAQPANDAGQVFSVPDRQNELERGGFTGAGRLLHLFDIGPHLADAGRYGSQHAGGVDGCDLEPGRIIALDHRRPAHSQTVVRVVFFQLGHVVALAAMNDQPLARRHVAHDVITRDGVTAFGIADYRAAHVAHGQYFGIAAVAAAPAAR